jgi:hypothetical protein
MPVSTGTTTVQLKMRREPSVPCGASRAGILSLRGERVILYARRSPWTTRCLPNPAPRTPNSELPFPQATCYAPHAALPLGHPHPA